MTNQVEKKATAHSNQGCAEARCRWTLEAVEEMKLVFISFHSF